MKVVVVTVVSQPITSLFSLTIMERLDAMLRGLDGRTGDMHTLSRVRWLVANSPRREAGQRILRRLSLV